MSYGRQAARYREMEVMSATPGQLVVLLYDHLLVTLKRTHIAVDAGDIELRCELLDKCRAIIGELLGTLNHERGGDIAGNLASLYTFLLCELVDIGLKPNAQRIDRITRIVSELRDAFAGAVQAPHAGAATTRALVNA